MQVRGRTGTVEGARIAPTRRRPVLLVTLEVPFEQAAAALAVDAAVECGEPLIVANVVEIPLGRLCVSMGYGDLEPTEDDARSLRAPAELARAFGVEVERLRVLSPHPLDALVELVAERKPSLLVFGPDPAKLSRRRYRKAVRAVRDATSCLVWIADE